MIIAVTTIIIIDANHLTVPANSNIEAIIIDCTSLIHLPCMGDLAMVGMEVTEDMAPLITIPEMNASVNEQRNLRRN